MLIIDELVEKGTYVSFVFNFSLHITDCLQDTDQTGSKINWVLTTTVCCVKGTALIILTRALTVAVQRVFICVHVWVRGTAASETMVIPTRALTLCCVPLPQPFTPLVALLFARWCGDGLCEVGQRWDTALVIPTGAQRVVVHRVCAWMYVCEEQPARDTGDPHKGTNSLLCPTSSGIANLWDLEKNPKADEVQLPNSEEFRRNSCRNSCRNSEFLYACLIGNSCNSRILVRTCRILVRHCRIL